MANPTEIALVNDPNACQEFLSQYLTQNTGNVTTMLDPSFAAIPGADGQLQYYVIQPPKINPPPSVYPPSITKKRNETETSDQVFALGMVRPSEQNRLLQTSAITPTPPNRSLTVDARARQLCHSINNMTAILKTINALTATIENEIANLRSEFVLISNGSH